MSDTQKNLEIKITTPYEGAGAKAAGSDLDKLTVGQRNLASSLPDLEQKTQQYVISSEAEYKAIVRAHESISAKIPVMEAAGKSTEEFRRAQENLSAALSSQNALLIAEQIENKAAAAAALEKAAADKIAAASAGLSSTAMREMSVVARELGRGNLSRIPGSLSILAGEFDLMKYVFSAAGLSIIGAGVAAYLLYDHLKKVNEELDKIGEAAAQPLDGGIQTVQTAWDEARKKLGEYQADLAAAAQDKDPTTTMIQRQKELDDAVLDGVKRQIEALGELEIAKLRQQDAGDPAKLDRDIAAAQARVTASVAALTGGRSVTDLKKELSESQAAAPALAAATQRAIMPALNANIADQQEQETLKKLRAANDPNAKAGSGGQTSNGVGLVTPADVEAKRQQLADVKKLSAENNNPGALKSAQDDLEIATAALARQRKLQAQIEAGETPAARAKRAADEQLSNARQAEIRNQQRIGAAPGEISQAEKLQTIKSATDAKVAEAKAQATVIEANTKSKTGDVLIGEKSDAYKILEGHSDKVDKPHQDLIQNLGGLMAGHAVTLQQAAELVARADVSNQNLQAALMAMDKTAAVMEKLGGAYAAKLQSIDAAIELAFQTISRVKTYTHMP